MQEIIGANDDILFDLDQIKRISQEKSYLTDGQRDRMKRLPKRKREEVEKEILAKKEQEKKTFLRIWTLELEDKVKQSDLPPEVVSQILEMTAYAKDRNMTFIYDIERRIEHVKEQVKEAEKKKMEEAMEKDRAVMGAVTGAVVGAVVAGAVLGPYVQVRYDKEEFEKRSETYLEEKIIPKLAMAAEEPIVPVETVRTYKKKQGAQYPKSQIALDQKHKSEWMELLVQKTQAEQKAKGQKVQTPEEIISSFGLLTEMDKKTTITGLKKENPGVAAKQEQETKVHDQAVIAKGIERLRRKHAKRDAKIAASKAKKAARENGQNMTQQAQGQQQPPVRPVHANTKEVKLEAGAKADKGLERLVRKKKEKDARKEKALEKMREQIALKKARIGSKGPRIAEREKTEKPIEITKETEQRGIPPKRPVVAKEEEKQIGKVKEFAKTPEGMAARKQAVQEQIIENKGTERLFDKGFSKFLAMAQERVQNESKSLTPAEKEQRKKVQERINKEGPNLFTRARREYGKVA